MTSVRIGCVKYLNTLPLIEGLGAWRDATLISAVPSRLIDILRNRDVDIALASVVDAARTGGRDGAAGKGGAGGGVVLIPAGMIGCDGQTLTVRLFSRVPIERITTVGADTDSHTSVVLMQVLLHRLHGLHPRVLALDAREHMVIDAGWAGENGAGRGVEALDALLLIGDKVVTDAPSSADYPHQLDLGQAWKDLTGLPFVYAVWMCREGEEDSPAVRSAAMMLDRQRRHNRTRLGWIVSGHAAERRWPEDLAARYVGACLKYDVGEAEREAVEKFLAWGEDLGLCARGSRVRWADLGSAV